MEQLRKEKILGWPIEWFRLVKSWWTLKDKVVERKRSFRSDEATIGQRKALISLCFGGKYKSEVMFYTVFEKKKEIGRQKNSFNLTLFKENNLVSTPLVPPSNLEHFILKNTRQKERRKRNAKGGGEANTLYRFRCKDNPLHAYKWCVKRKAEHHRILVDGRPWEEFQISRYAGTT